MALRICVHARVRPLAIDREGTEQSVVVVPPSTLRVAPAVAAAGSELRSPSVAGRKALTTDTRQRGVSPAARSPRTGASCTPRRQGGSAATGTEEWKGFSFDRVYDADDDQLEVFDGSVISAIESLLDDGRSSALICYGPTGSGKSHTVLGPPTMRNPLASVLYDHREQQRRRTSRELSGDAGVLPRVLHWLLRVRDSGASTLGGTGRLHAVSVSAVELYGDEVRDVLDDGRIIRTLLDNAGNITDALDGQAKRLPIDSVDDAYAALARANGQRAMGSHDLNLCSSRSHLFFIICVEQHRTVVDGERDAVGVDKSPLLGYYVVVDLAGCERVKQTRVVGTALREAMCINKSLSALSNVVAALDAGAVYVPYRDSKLTRLLRPCIDSGTALTMMIHVPPAYVQRHEALLTLEMASRMKAIPLPLISVTPSPCTASRSMHAEMLHAAAERASEEKIVLLSELAVAIEESGMQLRRLERAGRPAPCSHECSLPPVRHVLADERVQSIAAQHAAKVDALAAAVVTARRFKEQRESDWTTEMRLNDEAVACALSAIAVAREHQRQSRAALEPRRQLLADCRTFESRLSSALLLLQQHHNVNPKPPVKRALHPTAPCATLLWQTRVKPLLSAITELAAVRHNALLRRIELGCLERRCGVPETT